jgi:hypothetical protein
MLLDAQSTPVIADLYSSTVRSLHSAPPEGTVCGRSWTRPSIGLRAVAAGGTPHRRRPLDLSVALQRASVLGRVPTVAEATRPLVAAIEVR